MSLCSRSQTSVCSFIRQWLQLCTLLGLGLLIPPCSKIRSPSVKSQCQLWLLLCPWQHPHLASQPPPYCYNRLKPQSERNGRSDLLDVPIEMRSHCPLKEMDTWPHSRESGSLSSSLWTYLHYWFLVDTAALTCYCSTAWLSPNFSCKKLPASSVCMQLTSNVSSAAFHRHTENYN